MCTAAPFLRLSPHAGRGRPASIARRAGEGLPITYRPSPQPSQRCSRRDPASGAREQAVLLSFAPTSGHATSPLLLNGAGTPESCLAPTGNSPRVRISSSAVRAWGLPHSRHRKQARVRCSSFAPFKKRARGTPDARLRPQPRVHGLSLDTRVLVTTKAPDHPAFRTRGFFRLASHVPRWEVL